MISARIGLFRLCLLLVLLVVIGFVAARKLNIVFRPNYIPQTILLNPAGTCALVEYNYRGGERWYWLDPYRFFLMLEGDAFYNVINLRSRRILRDSTTAILALPAISRGLSGDGSWSFFGTIMAQRPHFQEEKVLTMNGTIFKNARV